MSLKRQRGKHFTAAASATATASAAAAAAHPWRSVPDTDPTESSL